MRAYPLLLRAAPLGALWLVLLLLPATGLAWTKFTPEELVMTAPEWCRDADVLVLDTRSEYLANPFVGLNGSHTCRIKVLTEKGKEQGSLDLESYYGNQITEINARTITPGGEVIKVKSSQIFKTTTYVGADHDIKRTVYRVAFPEVVAGSILEVQWKTFSGSLTFVPPHYFDVAGLPTQHSELMFTLVAGIIYNILPVNTERFALRESKEQGITLEGPQLTYRASVSNIRTFAQKPYAPADDFLRPHIYFVFARYETPRLRAEIVPDWKAAAKIVDDFFAGFQRKTKTVPTLCERIADGDSAMSRAQAAYRWVTDSIAYVDSRRWSDVDGSVDEILAARKATGVEKMLVLQALYKQMNIPATLMMIVPITEGPTLTALPTLSQFETCLLYADIDEHPVLLDPSYEGTAFGKYPWNLSGVHGLLVDPAQPQFIEIPASRQENRTTWDLECRIDSAGSLEASGTVRLTGQMQMMHRRALCHADSAGLREYVRKNFLDDCAEQDFVSAAFQDDPAGSVVTMAWRKANYGELLDTDLLLSPNCVSRLPAELLPQDEDRHVPIQFSFPRVLEITAHFLLPANFERVTTTVAAPMQCATPGIRYQAEIKPGTLPNEFTYTRTFRREQSEFPMPRYAELRAFFGAAAQHDAGTVVAHRSSPK